MEARRLSRTHSRHPQDPQTGPHAAGHTIAERLEEFSTDIDALGDAYDTAGNKPGKDSKIRRDRRQSTVQLSLGAERR